MAPFKIGDATVFRIEEVLELGFPAEFMLLGFQPSMLDSHPVAGTSNFFNREEGRYYVSIHSWLIQLHGKNILVDTCSGNGKARALPIFQRFHMLDYPYMDNLAAAGFAPEDIDIVFCTHLHIDHVGWNTRLVDGKWVPAFPNARYLFGRKEYEHWVGEGTGPSVFPENVAVIEDSVLPIVEAGRAEFLDDGDEILPGLTVEAAPGHTLDQLVLKYQSDAGSFVISADCIHHPVQVYEPHINSRFCEYPDFARETRAKVLAFCADTGAMLLPMHFGAPHAGRVRREGSGFVFEPANAGS